MFPLLIAQIPLEALFAPVRLDIQGLVIHVMIWMNVPTLTGTIVLRHSQLIQSCLLEMLEKGTMLVLTILEMDPFTNFDLIIEG